MGDETPTVVVQVRVHLPEWTCLVIQIVEYRFPVFTPRILWDNSEGCPPNRLVRRNGLLRGRTFVEFNVCSVHKVSTIGNKFLQRGDKVTGIYGSHGASAARFWLSNFFHLNVWMGKDILYSWGHFFEQKSTIHVLSGRSFRFAGKHRTWSCPVRLVVMESGHNRNELAE